MRPRGCVLGFPAPLTPNLLINHSLGFKYTILDQWTFPVLFPGSPTPTPNLNLEV